MSIQIINSGANLKIVVDSTARLIAKHTVKSIRIVQGNTIKLNTSSGCCTPADYIPYADVTAPATANIEALRDLLGDWLIQPSSPGTSPVPGVSTEAKQDDQIAETIEVKDAVNSANTAISTAIANNLNGKATVAKQDEGITKMNEVKLAVEDANGDITTAVTNGLNGKATVAKQDEGITKMNEVKLAVDDANADITTAITNNLSGKATAAHQLTQNTLLGDIDENLTELLPGIITAVSNGALTQATATKQDEQKTEIQNLGTLLSAIQTLLTQANANEIFKEPLRTEIINEDLSYEGFALPGATPASPVWAIRKRSCELPGQIIYTWAGGNKLLANIWNSRLGLTYS